MRLAGASVIACAILFGFGTTASAMMITFEDLGVGPGGILDVGVAHSGGFSFSSTAQTKIANSQFNYPFNGTTVGIAYATRPPGGATLTQDGGGVFSIQRFDFAGWVVALDEHESTVTGTRSDLSTITQSFTPDGLGDGNMGPIVDFQTFALTGDWTNLTKVTWVHFGKTTNGFALDNIVVNEAPAAVPEPSTLALLTLGVVGLAGTRLGRRLRG